MDPYKEYISVIEVTALAIVLQRCDSPNLSQPALAAVQGRFELPVTVIMLSLGVSGATRHLGFASEWSLRSSRFQLDPNILSG